MIKNDAYVGQVVVFSSGKYEGIIAKVDLLLDNDKFTQVSFEDSDGRPVIIKRAYYSSMIPFDNTPSEKADLDKACEDNPDLPEEFVREALDFKEDEVVPYERRTKDDESIMEVEMEFSFYTDQPRTEKEESEQVKKNPKMHAVLDRWKERMKSSLSWLGSKK